MKRILSCIVWFSCVVGTAAADCADEVNAAWRRLQSAPFSFEIAPEGSPPVPRIAGAFIWPSAMRIETYGPHGHVGHVYIGPRGWHYADGRWSGGSKDGHGTSAEAVLAFHAHMFSFTIQTDWARGVDSAACLGSVERDGRRYVAYSYKAAKGFMGAAEYVEHHKLYVDPMSGFPVRQEVEKEFTKAQPRFSFGREPGTEVKVPNQRHSTEFRPDGMLTIKPPN